jgi:PPP family 3-phenylpropionic acid transporter
VLSVGAAGLTPLVDARTIERLWPRRERFGQARVAGSIAFMAGTIGTGLVVGATRLEAMFVVYAVAMTGAGVAAAGLLGRPGRTGRVGSVGPVAALRLLRLPGLGLFFVGSCVVWANAVGSMALFSLRIEEVAGDSALVGVAWATSAAAEIPFMLLFSRLVRRFGVGRLIVAGALLFVVRAVLWSVSTTPLMLIASTAVGGGGYALTMVGTTSYIASRVPSQLQATAQALFSGTTFAFGSIAGSILAGQIASAHGLWAVYPVGAVAAAVGVVLIAASLRQGARRA